MLEKFVDHKMFGSSLKTIETANAIIDDYQADGLTLTLRQLYYQFVARDIIPNTFQSYKNLGVLVKKAREAGLMSWDAIEDRDRSALQKQGHDTVKDAIEDIPPTIVIDPWDDQDIYPEVWIEKAALSGTIDRTCNEYRAPYMACKGYLSTSEGYRAGKRFAAAVEAGKQPVLIHLGDHDPSGWDMTRDNHTRSELFSRSNVEIRRIALNTDQLKQYKPPPNPAKITDRRFAEYRTRFKTDQSWELDALNPRVIAKLVKDELESCITNRAAWKRVKKEETKQRDQAHELFERWDGVSDYLANGEKIITSGQLQTALGMTDAGIKRARIDLDAVSERLNE